MIAATFFFLSSQLAVGMLATLLLISPRTIGNSFFKFASLTAAIILGVTLGFHILFPSTLRAGQLPVVLLAASAILTTVYNRTVHIDKYSAALWLLIGAAVTGLLSVAADSLAFTRLRELGGWEGWILVIHNLTATMVLGTAMLTMVFGHWYLVVPKLSLAPLRLLTKVCIAAIALRAMAIVLTVIVLRSEQSVELSAIASELMLRQGFFFWPRFLFGVVAPMVLGAMIWSTVLIPNTQAATGLLYLSLVAVLFGEFFSKFLLFSLSVPI